MNLLSGSVCRRKSSPEAECQPGSFVNEEWSKLGVDTVMNHNCRGASCINITSQT